MGSGWLKQLALAGAVVVAAGCPGGGGEPEGPAGGSGSGTSTGSGGASSDGDPEARLRALVEDVVTLAEKTDCPRFGAALTSWTTEHEGEINSLITDLKGSAEPDKLAELDGYVEQRRLVVLEAAADCGDTDDAWPAWQEFERVVDEARD
jgi:hypothetical protein